MPLCGRRDYCSFLILRQVPAAVLSCCIFDGKTPELNPLSSTPRPGRIIESLPINNRAMGSSAAGQDARLAAEILAYNWRIRELVVRIDLGVSRVTWRVRQRY